MARVVRMRTGLVGADITLAPGDLVKVSDEIAEAWIGLGNAEEPSKAEVAAGEVKDFGAPVVRMMPYDGMPEEFELPAVKGKKARKVKAEDMIRQVCQQNKVGIEDWNNMGESDRRELIMAPIRELQRQAAAESAAADQEKAEQVPA